MVHGSENSILAIPRQFVSSFIVHTADILDQQIGLNCHPYEKIKLVTNRRVKLNVQDAHGCTPKN